MSTVEKFIQLESRMLLVDLLKATVAAGLGGVSGDSVVCCLCVPMIGILIWWREGGCLVESQSSILNWN